MGSRTNFAWSDFFDNFRSLDPSWNSGHFFFEKFTPRQVEKRLVTFGDDFGHFWNFENFFDFLEKFRKIDPPRNTGQKLFFQKKLPQNIFKTRLDTFGNDFGLFWIFEKF